MPPECCDSRKNPSPAEPAQRVKFTKFSASNQSELAEALDISAYLGINKGALNISANGELFKKKATAEADLNFVVKVTVKNTYRASETEPTFNWIEQANWADFYDVYGDSYVSNILEGGEFIGILSFKSRDSSELMNIKAKLEIGFSGIEAKGSGAYDTSELKRMAISTVNVSYSGARNVNPEGKDWTMELMFDEASKFPKKVAEGRDPVAVIIKKYTSLSSFIKVDNYKQYLFTENGAQEKLKIMLDDFAEFEKSNALLNATINDVNTGEVILTDSKSEKAYPASIPGLQKAIEDVTAAEIIIKSNSAVLRQSPSATTESTPGLKIYDPPSKVRLNLPVIKSLGTSTARPVVGSELSACAFTADQKLRAYAFWQDTTRAIHTAAFVDPTWSLSSKTVVASARANTPIAACCSSGGTEASVFHFTPQGNLNQRRLSNDDWSDGELFEHMKKFPATNKPHFSTGVAAHQETNGNIWVFYQGQLGQLVAAMFAADSRTWKSEVVIIQEGDSKWEIKPSLGSSVTAASVTPKNDHGAETFMIAWRGLDAKIYELRYIGGDTGWGKLTSVVSGQLPPETGLCAFNSGDNNVTLVISNEENRLLTSSWSKDRPNWTEGVSIGNGIKGGGIAAASWPNGSARVFMQTQDSMDLNDFVLNAGKWVLAGAVSKR